MITKRFYPLRIANKDPIKTIDLFYYQAPSGSSQGVLGDKIKSPRFIIHLLKTFLVFFGHKLQQEQTILYISVSVVLLILLKRNYYQNILNIVYLIKQLL